MKISCIVCFTLLVLVSCNSGGSKTSGDKAYANVFAKHEPRIAELRSFLSSLTGTLKDAGTTAVTVGTTDPVINLGNYDTTGNTLILQYHLLAAPEGFTNDSLFGLYYNMLAADAFKWSGTTKERMIFEQDYLKDEDVDRKLAPLSTTRFPYLLIVKATEFKPLINNGDETFAGGNATASFYLYDWRSKKELSAISLTAKPDQEMLYAYQAKGGSSAKFEAAAQEAKKTMQKDMRMKLYSWLKEITGGTAIVPQF
jgi:hypothetical protein